ncbi:uncharacterized protein LOC126898862 [Daktulosphaira vitifoliae]|uniref:uncharacterized protein LOC126898862 n=1 Tax=Daktulosphaira vitifoliae TaxID=58002 RepID=UPI0021A9D4F0|nr:uncharacterized protein LOC126898862 [Daktulosphaira vitifoliae]
MTLSIYEKERIMETSKNRFRYILKINIQLKDIVILLPSKINDANGITIKIGSLTSKNNLRKIEKDLKSSIFIEDTSLKCVKMNILRIKKEGLNEKIMSTLTCPINFTISIKKNISTKDLIFTGFPIMNIIVNFGYIEVIELGSL